MAGSATSGGLAAFRQLTLLSTRELLRNVKTVLSLLFMFFFFLILMVGVDYSVNGGRPAPTVAVVQSELAPQLQHELSAMKIKQVTDDASKPATAIITVKDGQAVIQLATKEKPSWKELSRAVEAVGVPASKIAVVDANGSPEVDVLRINLATVLVTGFMAIAFIGTSIPLTAMRQKGTLRLLGTTPVNRLAFILSQSPVRLALGLAEAAVILVVAWTQGYVASANLLRLSVTLVIGLLMLFALAYLLASRSTNADVITQITGFLPVIVILTSGTVMPSELFPAPVQFITRCFPTTWFMQAVGADASGVTPFVPVYWLWLMMGVVTVAAAILSARIFKWDQGEL